MILKNKKHCTTEN